MLGTMAKADNRIYAYLEITEYRINVKDPCYAGVFLCTFNLLSDFSSGSIIVVYWKDIESG